MKQKRENFESFKENLALGHVSTLLKQTLPPLVRLVLENLLIRVWLSWPKRRERNVCNSKNEGKWKKLRSRHNKKRRWYKLDRTWVLTE